MTTIDVEAPSRMRRLVQRAIAVRRGAAGLVLSLWAALLATSAGAQWAGNQPQTNMVPIPQPALPPGASGFNSPLYDPYSSSPGAGAYAPAVPGTAPVASQFPGWLPGGSSQSPGGFGGLFPGSATAAPTFGPGNPGFTSDGLGQAGYGSPPIMPHTEFPPEAYPSAAPSTLFPGGVFGGPAFGASTPFAPLRLMQGPRIRHGWVRGGDGDKAVQMNETDLSVVFAFPNFMYTGQPIFVSPAFGLTLLEGPKSISGADLPGQVYSATLESNWQSDPNRMLGVDLGLKLGMFSDFDTNIGDSFRILGRGLGLFRMTPYSTLKGGVYYLDRNRIKLLPAAGILYQPTPLTRYDIFFPEPKLSHYFTTLGTQDLWTYVGAQYGGGSWTVQRESGVAERVDINDIRILLGVEWGRNDLLRQGSRTGFFEVGYVFDRELVYKRNPQDNIRPSDTIMLRVGLGY